MLELIQDNGYTIYVLFYFIGRMRFQRIRSTAIEWRPKSSRVTLTRTSHTYCFLCHDYAERCYRMELSQERNAKLEANDI
jgi:hypothetical protein